MTPGATQEQRTLRTGIRRRPARVAVVALAVSCAVAAFAPPVGAAKRRIKRSFDVQAAPYPALTTSGAKDSCIRQVALGESYATFDAPAKGVLTAQMKGFTGDWDLFVLDASNALLSASVKDQLRARAPAEEEVILVLRKGDTVNITPCNWLGAPQATVDWMFEYRTPRRR